MKARRNGNRFGSRASFEAGKDHGTRVSLDALMRLKGAAAMPPLVSRKKKFSALAGSYLSPFRGRGIDFDSVRVYQPGDDIRAMDWRVTARSGVAHTKVFHEERERSAYLLVDQGPSMFFGSRRAFKSVAAAEVAAWLTWALDDYGDRIGAIIHGADTETELRPARGMRAVARLLKALVDAGETIPASTHSAGVAAVLERVRRVARPGSLIFAIGDFRSFDSSAERHLAQLARHNDVVALLIYDPLEAQLPPPGDYRVTDGDAIISIETGAQHVVDTYRRSFDQRRTKLENVCRKHGIRFVMLGTHQDVAECLPTAFGHGQRLG